MRPASREPRTLYRVYDADEYLAADADTLALVEERDPTADRPARHHGPRLATALGAVGAAATLLLLESDRPAHDGARRDVRPITSAQDRSPLARAGAPQLTRAGSSSRSAPRLHATEAGARIRSRAVAPHGVRRIASRDRQAIAPPLASRPVVVAAVAPAPQSPRVEFGFER